MFACSVMEGETVVFAPLGANSGFSLYDGFARSVGEMNASACGAGPGDVDDLDDFR